MIKIHTSSCNEGPSSLLKISLSEKEEKKTKRKFLARLSQEKNEIPILHSTYVLNPTHKVA
jgi:hypothetical protein